jgi:NUMOD4 motif/HNH endonuclease
MTAPRPSRAAIVAAEHGVTVADLLAAFEAKEHWRKVPDWPYEVSSFGRVRRTDSGKILAPVTSIKYPHITLSDQSVQHNARVHRLVVEAFLGAPPFAEAETAHNDGNSHNSRARNLRWASALENQADRERHATKIVGSAVFGAKLTEADIPAIRRRAKLGERYPTIAADYGVSVSTVSLIVLGRIWRHVTDDMQARAAA